MLRALLIGSLLVVPAKIAAACDDDDNEAEDADDDSAAEAETPDEPEVADNALEARLEALEQRVDAIDRSCDDGDADDGAVDFEFEID